MYFLVIRLLYLSSLNREAIVESPADLEEMSCPAVGGPAGGLWGPQLTASTKAETSALQRQGAACYQQTHELGREP